MRIAVVNDTVYPFFKGGAQKRVYEISRRLVQRGHEVHWYGMDYGARELEGIRLHAVCPAYKLYTSTGHRIVWQALGFAARLNIREKVDVIDCMNFPYLHCFRAKESAIRLRIPLIITWFEFWGDYWYKYMGRLGMVGKAVEKAVSRLPDMIIADSEKVREQLVRAGTKDTKIRVVPDGVDTNLIVSTKPARKRYDIVCVGRVLPHKNVDLLLHALAKMNGVTAAIVGDGTSRKEYERLSTKLGIESKVKFFGHVLEDKDVYAIMKSAKVLAMLSVQEGHPLVIPEANACGIPVVGIKGVCDEFINHGQTGYLTAPHEYPVRLTLARALEMYPRFKALCTLEAKKYDWEVITDKVEAAYEEIA